MITNIGREKGSSLQFYKNSIKTLQKVWANKAFKTGNVSGMINVLNPRR